MKEREEQGDSPTSPLPDGQPPSPADGGSGVERWLGRAVITLVGLVVVVGGVLTSVKMAQQLAAAPSQDVGVAAVLPVVGTGLRSIGLGVLMIGQAVTFTKVAEFFWPFTVPPGVPQSNRQRRAHRRQIRGVDGWTPAEVPALRTEAAWLLSVPSPPRVVAAGVIMFCVGMILAPIELPGLAGAGSFLSRAVQVLAAGLLVAYVVAVIGGRGDRRAAQQFLEKANLRTDLGS